MVISTKPDDRDGIVELVKDAVGNEKYVPTRALITFFDDISNQLESLRPLDHTDGAQMAVISSIAESILTTRADLRSEIAAVESRINSVPVPTENEALRQIISQQSAEITALRSQLSELNEKISNIEQTSWQ